MMSCVSVSLDIGILRWSDAASLPPPPQPTLAMQPAGQDPEARLASGTVTTTALFTDECQSFLDNVIADLRQIGAWNDRRLCDAGQRAPARSSSAAMGRVTRCTELWQPDDPLCCRLSQLRRFGELS